MATLISRRRTALLFAALTPLALLPATPAHANHDLTYGQYEEFQLAVAADTDEYWTNLSASRDVRYSSPGIVFAGPGQVARSACNAVVGDPVETNLKDVAVSPAFFCPADITVYLSSTWMYRDIYQEFGDFGAAAVVAHEWAHHVQFISGTTNPGTKENELQADCWAGTWAADVGVRGLLESGDLSEAALALYTAGDYEFGSPDHHGTPKERFRWFQYGFDTGDPGECNP